MAALRGSIHKLLIFGTLLSLAQSISISDTTDDVHLNLQRRRPMQREMGKANISPVAERKASFWINQARGELRERVKRAKLNTKRAKNVIMFLGDGMPLTTVAAARIRKGQHKGQPGEESKLSFEEFPYIGLSKTYCTNAQVADSACTATAYLCGVKTNFMELGVTANVSQDDCAASMNPANHVSSIAAWAQAAGKSTGIITTTTLTHASPAGAYAHAANRFWESDADIVKYSGVVAPGCMDIAQQLVTQAPGRHFDVMMGGGMGKFLPDSLIDSHGKAGERRDGRNLLSQWQGLHPQGLIVTSRDQLLNLNVSRVTNIVGLFQSSVMDFHLFADKKKQPTLAEMTRVALTKLKQNKKGYFVFIEGGLIDYGNHFNQAVVSLDETLELAEAVKVARDMTSESDTLIVLTADHGHPMTMSGYTDRGNDIVNLNEATPDKHGVKYATLSYSVGKEQYLDVHGKRIDLTEAIGGDSFVFPSYISADMGVHSGEDVGIFASGPHAHLFSGSLQQSTIPHLMAYAACLSDGPTMCKDGK